MTQGYIFDVSTQAERDRLAAQATLWDRFTRGRLDETGLAPGWRCLEVGGGTGSIAEWLADRVGPRGHVVATDLDVRWLTPLSSQNLQVMRHDVVTEPLGDEVYDLVHARLVLTHLPDPVAVVHKLVAALKPGGWLVLEDYDTRSAAISDPPDATWEKIAAAPAALIAMRGGDGNFGARLPGTLRSAGLVELDVKGQVQPARAVDARDAWRPIFGQLREPIIATGMATADEVDEIMAQFDDEDCERVICWPTLISARGRKPR